MLLSSKRTGGEGSLYKYSASHSPVGEITRAKSQHPSIQAEYQNAALEQNAVRIAKMESLRKRKALEQQMLQLKIQEEKLRLLYLKNCQDIEEKGLKFGGLRGTKRTYIGYI